MAMEFGPNWLKPIQERLHAAHADIAPSELDEINAICQAAMRHGHRAVYEMAEKAGGQASSAEFAAAFSAIYPWATEGTVRGLFSQGMYYAWKDGLVGLGRQSASRVIPDRPGPARSQGGDGFGGADA